MNGKNLTLKNVSIIVTGNLNGGGKILNHCNNNPSTYCVRGAVQNNPTISVTRNYDCVPPSCTKTWNGSVSTNWNVANNWTPSGVPTINCDVLINNTVPCIISTNNAEAKSITVSNAGSLNINNSGIAKVKGKIDVAATANFILENASSLIKIDDVVNEGSITMKRTTSITKMDYVYWSSPVESFNVSNVSPNSSLIYKWIPTISTNLNGFGNWAGAANEVMVKGKGYIVRGPNNFSTTTPQNFTAIFTGKANNGTILTPIARGTYSGPNYFNGGTKVTSNDDNWNLIGNPYPSAIDAIDFLTANPSIDGYIMLWTHGTSPSSAYSDPFYEGFVYNYSIADYIRYNNLGASNGPDVFNGYIAAGQGFFVSMLDGGPDTQNLNFTNALRSNTYDNGQFYRNTNNSVTSNEKHRIWLDIINTTNNSSMTALIGYADGASNSRDRLYDAETDNKVTLNLFSLIDDVKFAIQGRQTPFDDNDVVPLGFRTPSSGIYSIGIKSIDGLFETTAQAIFLHDLELNIIHDLRSMPYSFQANEGTNNNRFNLIFKNTLSENTTELNDNSVWVSSSTGLTVHSSIENISSIKVFDILDRVITNKEKVTSKTIVLDQILKTNSGLILEITLENNKVLYKKVVY
ncbi:hypothetical protein [Flavobacterium haoranii]|uniref:Por secretion system C-terminal sorting domain-containing protein n=1 Tax=Flavobacterium haoranii TaxID=683124 RepID=A0A1M6IUX2_9FLAO|nr:hypothetical protein [Flavobacterium haoranii]SHJ38247.1 hypothetical protein SAMN05444337_1881 [Flavobacterium haoranii]